MALVCRSEVSALTRLLRGLCIKKQSCDVASARQLSVAASCIHQKQLSSTVDAHRTTIVPMPMSSLCLSLTRGAYLPQHRHYAKAAPPQRNKLSFDYSGDLATQKPLDPQAKHVDFKDCALPESASESVEKLCSIGFASGSEKKLHRKEEMKERILQLFGEEADREMHVAMLTVDIRNMIPHVLTDRKDKLSKSRLVEKIQLRKKMLKKLRREDYQRFLWLLQTLRIRYVLPPDYHKHVTKKYWRKQRVWEAANAQRQAKITALKEQLQREKEEFLQHKAQVLQQLAQDAEKHGLDLQDFQQQLQRKREGRTYPTILSWEERLQLPEGHPLKPEIKS